MSLREIQIFVDAGVSVEEEASAKIAARVFWPAELSGPPSVALFCLPGGSINAGYYDLGAELQPSFSFARQMAKHGLITIALDHLGVGASTRPADILTLTPDVVAAANARATQELTEAAWKVIPSTYVICEADNAPSWGWRSMTWCARAKLRRPS